MIKDKIQSIIRQSINAHLVAHIKVNDNRDRITILSEEAAEKCEEIAIELAVDFAEFLRLNYQNSALEFDNYWEEVVQGEFNKELGKAYTTKELLQIYLNKENGK